MIPVSQGRFYHIDPCIAYVFFETMQMGATALMFAAKAWSGSIGFRWSMVRGHGRSLNYPFFGWENQTWCKSIWVCPKIMVPQNGWFIRENPMNKWMIWGENNPIFGNTHIVVFSDFPYNSSVIYIPWITSIIGSMGMVYSIYPTFSWCLIGQLVGKYTIHWSYGYCFVDPFTFFDHKLCCLYSGVTRWSIQTQHIDPYSWTMLCCC